MKQDEIIEIARQAGFVIHTHKPSLITVENEETWVCVNKELEAFAKLVEERTAAKERADEREACLKICEAQAQTNYWEGADVCAEAIRARGQQ